MEPLRYCSNDYLSQFRYIYMSNTCTCTLYMLTTCTRYINTCTCIVCIIERCTNWVLFAFFPCSIVCTVLCVCSRPCNLWLMRGNGGPLYTVYVHVIRHHLPALDKLVPLILPFLFFCFFLGFLWEQHIQCIVNCIVHVRTLYNVYESNTYSAL